MPKEYEKNNHHTNIQCDVQSCVMRMSNKVGYLEKEIRSDKNSRRKSFKGLCNAINIRLDKLRVI